AELLAARDGADRADGDPRLVHRIQQEAQAGLLLCALVGADQGIHLVGVRRAAGPDLVAVDDPLVALEARFGARTGEVGTGVGFGKALAPAVLAAQYLRQVLRALRVGAEQDQRGADVHHALRRDHRRA